MDPEAKAREIQALRKGNAAALQKAISALGDSDPITQEWATVALRDWKGDPNQVGEALLDFFWRNDREALRCYALESLGHLGLHLPMDSLPGLIEHYRDTPKPRVLGKALRWIGLVATHETVLPAMLDLAKHLPANWPGRDGFLKRHKLAVLRLAKRDLVENRRDKAWFHAHGVASLLDDLGENRIETAIRERAFHDSQRALLSEEEMEQARQDEPLVPGRPLADDPSHFIQDMAELAKADAKTVERVVYLRSQAKAREAKRLAGYKCRVCGAGLPGGLEASRFVHAHHIRALGGGGKDELENLIVLCPNCHSSVHSKTYSLVACEGRWVLKTKTEAATQPSSNAPGPHALSEPALKPGTSTARGDEAGPPDTDAGPPNSAGSATSDLQTMLELIPRLESEAIKVVQAALEHQVSQMGRSPQVPLQFEETPAPVRAARGEYLLELFRNAEKPEEEQLRLAAKARARLGIGPEHGVFHPGGP